MNISIEPNSEGVKGMELLDLLIEIERYISRKGLTYSDSIESLTEALTEDSQED